MHYTIRWRATDDLMPQRLEVAQTMNSPHDPLSGIVIDRTATQEKT
jgi:hypothetical protein